MSKIKEECWIITARGGKLFGRGSPKDRWLVLAGEPTNRKIMTFSTKHHAQTAINAGFKVSERTFKYVKRYYDIKNDDIIFLDEIVKPTPVRCKMILTFDKEDCNMVHDLHENNLDDYDEGEDDDDNKGDKE